MEKKINIAELLKDCPKGMELYSTIYGTVYFEGVRDTGYATLIDVTAFDNTKVQFYPDGKFNTYYSDSEMTLFPSKDVRTWEGFQRPFKDGDIITTLVKKDYLFYSIYKNREDKKILTYIDYCQNSDRIFNYNAVLCFANEITEQRLSTEEEKQKLFQAIKDNGYKWNAETKALEKLVKPKFKVGDRIKTINKMYQYDITELTDTHYTLVEVEDKFKYTEPIIEDKNWELVPNKFDINTLIPFESKVLMRDDGYSLWQPGLWGFYDKEHRFPYVTIGNRYKQCIPYRGNEYLLGTNDKCDDYYKTWE